MPVYADPDDLGKDPPEQAGVWLLLASRVIEHATLTAFYRTDPDTLLPTEPDVRELFRAATVAQVAYWQALDLDPTQGDAGVTSERRAASKSIGSASVSYESGATADTDRVNALRTLAPAAVAILDRLPRGPVIVHG